MMLILFAEKITIVHLLQGFVAEEHKNIEKTYPGWYGSLIARMFRNKKTTNSKGWCMKQLIHLLNQSREK